ncbi:MAG: DUF6570 domain-containing protein [Cetobacterium sp.]
MPLGDFSHSNPVTPKIPPIPTTPKKLRNASYLKRKAERQKIRRARKTDSVPPENEGQHSTARISDSPEIPGLQTTPKRLRSEPYLQDHAARAKLTRDNMSPEKKRKCLHKRRMAYLSTIHSMTPEDKEEHRQRSAAHSSAARAIRRENQRVINTEKVFDFNTMVSDNLSDLKFTGYEQDPQTAALLYYANSGHTTFWPMNFVLDDDGNIVEEQFDLLKEEIQDQVLSESEIEHLLYKFNSYQGKSTSSFRTSNPTTTKHQPPSLSGLPPSLDAHKLVCGACGVQSVHGLYGKNCTTVALQDLPSCMELCEADLAEYKQPAFITVPVNDNGDTMDVNLSKLKSVYESSDLKKAFHLHPEFVHWHDNGVSKQEMTALCPSCSLWYQSTKTQQPNRRAKNISTPPNSIASGIDFGDLHRIGLQKPSPLELMIIAKHRHFHNVAKVNTNHRMGERSDLTENQLRCHSILFKHDAPVTASIALMFFQWLAQHDSDSKNEQHDTLRELFNKILTVQLIGPEGEIENIGRKAKMQTHIQARAYVVYQWLAVLQHVHPLYQNDPKLEITHFSDFHIFLQQCNSCILDNTVALTSQSVRDAEKVSGDDIAQVRTAILTKSDLSKIRQSTSSHHDDSGMNISYSFVADTSLPGADTLQSNRHAQRNLDVILKIAEVQLPAKDPSSAELRCP